VRNLLRSRRGSAAFATVIALVPLIGVVALGGEAGSWYVTKQHAQNAADAAAYSGALKLACQLGSNCPDTQSVDYRGKEFASQNTFCNAGDATAYPGRQCAASLPTGVSQAVTIATLTSWNGVNGNFVQATVQQTQPAYLAAVLLGFTTIPIGATAIAKVNAFPQPPCILALKDPITFQGSPTVSSADCGIASNSTAPNAIGFKGNNGINVNALSYTAGDCSQTGGTQCSNVITYTQPVPDPLSGLNSAMSSLKTSNFSGGKCSSLSSYDTKQCYNGGNTNLSGLLNGTYYFNGAVKIGGGTTATGTATLVLFGSATLTINGNPSMQLTAEKIPQVPPALSSVQSLMADLLIYDPEPYSKQGVNVTGDSSSYFKGIVYVPNSPVTYGGNSTVATPSCIEVIAYAVNFSGNTKLDNSTCQKDGAVVPKVQVVQLVQ
jgi:Flp pilus assembly protein TadG